MKDWQIVIDGHEIRSVTDSIGRIWEVGPDGRWRTATVPDSRVLVAASARVGTPASVVLVQVAGLS